MEKKVTKIFKEYTQCWRNLVTQVNLPLFDKKMVSTFIGILHPLFYDLMVHNMSSNFFDIVTIGEMIEYMVKIGRIVNNSIETIGAKKLMFNKKKVGEFMPLVMKGKKENWCK